MIYFDNAATTKVCEIAAESAVYVMTEKFGNPSSLHGVGLDAEKLVNFSKDEISKAMGCSQDEIIFTSGATESNNTAILGLAKCYGKKRKKVVVTSVEHPSVIEPFEVLKTMGFEVVTVRPNDDGEITEDMLIDAVDENTCLISAMLVNNETGYILPIAKAFKEIKLSYPECMTHCDAVQGFMKLPIKVKNLCADAISFSGHKIYAPKGVGGLYLKKGVRITPLLCGGGQQKNLRSGTESVPLIYSLGKTVEALSKTVDERFEKVKEINLYARSELSKLSDVIINSKENASPYILSVSVLGYRSETLLHFLEKFEIYVSSGSACSRGKKSSVLSEFKVSDKAADSTLRLSFSYDSKKEDVDELIKALAEAKSSLTRSTK